jgi:hypothetical protein
MTSIYLVEQVKQIAFFECEQMVHNTLAAFGKYFQEHQKDESLLYRGGIWRVLVRMQQISLSWYICAYGTKICTFSPCNSKCFIAMGSKYAGATSIKNFYNLLNALTFETALFKLQSNKSKVR